MIFNENPPCMKDHHHCHDWSPSTVPLFHARVCSAEASNQIYRSREKLCSGPLAHGTAISSAKERACSLNRSLVFVAISGPYEPVLMIFVTHWIQAILQIYSGSVEAKVQG